MSMFCALNEAFRLRTRALCDSRPFSNGSSIVSVSAELAPGSATTVYLWPVAAVRVARPSSVCVPAVLKEISWLPVSTLK